MTKLSLSNSLTDLAARIKIEHEATATALKRSVEHAIAAGALLIEAKAQIRHGQWLSWLKDHCQVSERMAQRYIRLARNRELIEAKCDTVSDLGVQGALALITVNRTSADDFVACNIGLADHAAECAFDAQDYFDTPKAKTDHHIALWDEVRATIEKLAGPYPDEMADLIDRETEDAFTRFHAACYLYGAATAAECGITPDELDRIVATINEAKSQDADEWQIAAIAFNKHPDLFNRDPLPGPTPISVLVRVRDAAKDLVGQVEMIVAREGDRAEAAP